MVRDDIVCSCLSDDYYMAGNPHILFSGDRLQNVYFEPQQESFIIKRADTMIN